MPAIPGTNSLSHNLTRLIGALAALVLLAVSAAMNYLFLSSLGKTPTEAHVLGAASAAADLLKAVLPFLIFWGWRAGRLSVAGPGLLVWSVFSMFSLLSAIGFAAGNREHVADSRTATTLQYAAVRSDLETAEHKRKRLPEHRAAEIMTEAINRHKQHRRWVSTNGCRNATVPDSRAYCRAYFALRAEQAAAERNGVLTKKIENLRAQARMLRAAGGTREPEPQVSLLARLFGLERDPVRLALILLVAALVELGSGLGLYLSMSGPGAGRLERAGKTSPRRRNRKPKASSAAQRLDGTVEDFAWACVQPATGNTVSERALFAAYQHWCTGQRHDALQEPAFRTAFERLARTLGLRRGANGYEGIAVSASPAMNTQP